MISSIGPRLLPQGDRPDRLTGVTAGLDRDSSGAGATQICGMDEVGRGALAGPLVAAAVVLPENFGHPLLRDSKRLSPAQRERLTPLIRAAAMMVLVIEVSPAEIDRRGMGWANRAAFESLLAAAQADQYLIDGNLRLNSPKPHRCLIGGDGLIPAISAASVVAKVHRDRLMVEMDRDFPAYQWGSNKGYGSAVHLAAIRDFGTTPQHRLSFLHQVETLPF